MQSPLLLGVKQDGSRDLYIAGQLLRIVCIERASLDTDDLLPDITGVTDMVVTRAIAPARRDVRSGSSADQSAGSQLSPLLAAKQTSGAAAPVSATGQQQKWQRLPSRPHGWHVSNVSPYGELSEAEEIAPQGNRLIDRLSP